MIGRSQIQKKYIIKEKLGQGSFATVKRCIRKEDKAEFALKIIQKKDLKAADLDLISEEVEIMHKVKHPNCVQLYDYYEGKSNFYMVIEYLSGGELFDQIVKEGCYSERDTASVIRKTMGALKYLHSIGIVHRDLKPENMIYKSPCVLRPDGTWSTPEILITDFGLASHQETGSKMSTACGTPGYVAPEVLLNRPYGPSVDVWSMGVILYILLSGYPPFYDENTNALYKQIMTGAYDFPAQYWADVSDSAKNLIRGMLMVDPDKRLTPQQILDDPWVGGGMASEENCSADKLNRLRMMQNRQLLRKGVRSIIAVQRFQRSMQYMIAGKPTPVSPKKPDSSAVSSRFSGEARRHTII
jgi:calcium/calmodulin-dependent protein kinase I